MFQSKNLIDLIGHSNTEGMLMGVTVRMKSVGNLETFLNLLQEVGEYFSNYGNIKIANIYVEPPRGITVFYEKPQDPNIFFS